MHRRVDRVHPAAALVLGRDAGVVDQRMQQPAFLFQPLADFGNGGADVTLVGEIDLDVIVGTGWPRAIVGKCLARAGDDAPAFARKALHRRMADAAAGSGQNDRLSPFGLLGHCILISSLQRM
ncbi:hypothetical protein D9M69_656800 [compost metagenome]